MTFSKVPVMERLRARLKATESGCWEYHGYRVTGYGYIGHGGSYELTHRLMYRTSVGPIPPGYFVCHRCDNPPCCNPEHLFLGTVADNNRDMTRKGRGNNQKKTQCKNGHQFSPETAKVDSRGRRFCRLCHSERNKAYKRRLRSERRKLCNPVAQP